MLNCYYCNRPLLFTPKFKIPDRSHMKGFGNTGNGPAGPQSKQEIICPVCKAIYEVTVEVLRPTMFKLEVLEQYKNKPHE